MGADDHQVHVRLPGYATDRVTHYGVGVEGGLEHNESCVVEEFDHSRRKIGARVGVVPVEAVERREDVDEVLDVYPDGVVVGPAEDVRQIQEHQRVLVLIIEVSSVGWVPLERLYDGVDVGFLVLH